MDINIIEIEWEGPHSLEYIIEELDGDADYGVYQAYGTHSINGANALLYIGQANHQTFSKRFTQHHDWLSGEATDVSIYVGRVGGGEQPDMDEWEQDIKDAERLLIYYCTPPYNSSGINDYGEMSPTIVMNFGKMNKLPFEISTLYEESEYAQEEWEAYAAE